jgi:hypothetical protein
MLNMKVTFAALAVAMVGAGSAAAVQVPFSFTASVSNGITITGQVMVETTNPGCVPGGMVEFNSGGITSFYFSATNGSITEVIDSSVIVPTPQTMRLIFSVASFPAIEAWDFSFSNEWYGGILIQMITVHSPSNSGYEQWAGNQLGGFTQPSNGAWLPPNVVATDQVVWGSLKSLFR